MTQSIPADVQPSVLRWARQSIDLTDVATRKIGVPDDPVRAWESRARYSRPSRSAQAQRCRSVRGRACCARGGVVVTEKTRRSIELPRIPDVCDAIGVRCIGLVDFVEERGLDLPIGVPVKCRRIIGSEVRVGRRGGGLISVDDATQDQPLRDRTESGARPGPAQTGIHGPTRERPRPSPGMGIERPPQSAGLLATCGLAPKRCGRPTNVGCTHRRENAPI